MRDYLGFFLFIAGTAPVVLSIGIYMILSRLDQNNQSFRNELRQLSARLAQQQNLLEELLKQLSGKPQPEPVLAEADTQPAQQPTAPIVVALEETAPALELAAPSTSQAAVFVSNELARESLLMPETPETVKPEPWVTPPLPPRSLNWQPAQPSRFEQAAKQILQEIWNWIIVGEGHRPEGMSLEYAIASNWLLRIGVLILVTGVGFFLKYSIDNGILGEQARVALAMLAGVGMLVGGVKLAYGKYHLFSQGLLGGGIAVLYFSVFSAHSFYHLIGVYPSFALMLAVTATAAVLSVRLDSMLVAIFAIIGGYCTPILLSTGQANFVGLYSYMLLLGAGLLSINWYKQWHLLNFLSFLFNYLLVFGSLQQYQTEYFGEVMPFLAAFFVLYSTAVFLYCLANRKASNLLDVLALILNAAVFFLVGRHLISQVLPDQYQALLCVGIAAFYVLHAYYCLLKRVDDRGLLLSFIGLAAFFTALTLPLLWSDQWLTVSWSLQALLMMWLSGKLSSRFLRQAAMLLYLLVVARMGLLDMPGQYQSAFAEQQTASEFLLGLLQRVMTFGLPIASLWLGYRLSEQPAEASELACPPDSDAPQWLSDSLLGGLMLVVGGLLFIVLQLELFRSFGYWYAPLQLPVLTLFWLATAGLLLNGFLQHQRDWMLTLVQMILIVLAVKFLLFDLPSWGFMLGSTGVGDSVLTLRYAGDYRFDLGLMRLLDFGAVLLFLVLMAQRLADHAEQSELRQYLLGAALGLLFIFLSLEVNSVLFQFVPGLRSGGVSILWSVFALNLVYFGIRRQARSLRLVGLGLFALVAWKVFFIDLARLAQIYRILAFLLLGMVVLGGAFFYMRFQQSFVQTKDETES